MDDNSTNLRILEKTLKHHFSHMIDISSLKYAVDGEKALEAYHENVYDLILLDIDMPRMSGVEVAQTIRKSDQDIIIIACTTSDSIISRELYTKVGMDGCVRKPLDLRVLNDNLEKSVLTRRHKEVALVLQDTHATRPHRNSTPVILSAPPRLRSEDRAASESVLAPITDTRYIPRILPSTFFKATCVEEDGTVSDTASTFELSMTASIDSAPESPVSNLDTVLSHEPEIRRYSYPTIPCLGTKMFIAVRNVKDNLKTMLGGPRSLMNNCSSTTETMYDNHYRRGQPCGVVGSAS